MPQGENTWALKNEARVQRERLCVRKGKLLSIVRASESIRNQSYSNRPRSELAAVRFTARVQSVSDKIYLLQTSVHSECISYCFGLAKNRDNEAYTSGH